MYQKLFQLQEGVFKVIANQKRLEILQLLTNEELSVSEMEGMLGIRQANLSQHLALLRQNGLVKTRRAGLNVYYQLSDKKIAQAVRLIREFLAVQHNLRPEQTKAFNGDTKKLYPVVKDVVCGMRLSASGAAAHSQHGHGTYYFCAVGCKDKFDANPTQYVNQEEL